MYSKLTSLIGFSFKDEKLLEMVFTHRSFVNEHKKQKVEHNERLEFLGDAVLELIITDYLFKKYPTAQEGELTSLRSALVRKENLAKTAKHLRLGEYLKLSKGEENSGGREKDYILANTCEALIGSIYLDRGVKKCEGFIKKHILSSLDTILKNKLHIDNKSALQEYTQERLKLTPVYKMITSAGPDHEKSFTMGVYFKDSLIAQGEGCSKRKAEEKAAEKALKKIQKN